MARNLSHRDGNMHSADEADEQFMSMLMLMVRQAAAGMNNHYHFKGLCYIQGWMKGEILDETGGTDEEIFETGKAAVIPNTVPRTHYLNHRFGL